MKLEAIAGSVLLLAACVSVSACVEEGDANDLADGETVGDGDGDPTTGDGDGDPTTGDGDGDGDPTTGDGDGDGDPTTGDGDGDPTTGDGDGDACGVDPGWGTFTIGQPAKHVASIDHEGNARNICEFAGTPMGLDIAAVWCGPCNDVSSYLAGQNENDPFGFGQQIRDMVNGGTGKWITYIVEDANTAPSTVMNATAWDAQYHNDNIPVMAEGDTPMLPTFFQVGCWPTVWVVDKDMNWLAGDDCQTWSHLQALVAAAGG